MASYLVGRATSYWCKMDTLKVWQAGTRSTVFDRRLADSAPAARFLERIKQRIEDSLLLLGHYPTGGFGASFQ